MKVGRAMAACVSGGLRSNSFHIFLLLAVVVSDCCGHLVLTYPPARKYPLDSLTNVTTQAPCGMPKDPDLAQYTAIPAGSELQVTWDVAYPRRGGVFVELLDKDDRVLQRYPTEGYALNENVSQLNYTVKLPDQACDNCTIRVVTRSLEVGDDFLFWSCSDVNLVTTPMSVREMCTNHGTHVAGRCECDRTYEGDLCQYQNECMDDGDCSNHGQCVDTQSSRPPRLQCFCFPGWFGRMCEKESTVKNKTDIDLSQYKKQSVSADYEVYHRILMDTQELEVVLRARSVTWIALGWRPQDANKTCQRFPVLSKASEGLVSAPSVEPARETPVSVTEITPTHNLIPEPCRGICNAIGNCLYDVSWTNDPLTQLVTFTLSVHLGSGEYFGLGFSHDEFMPDSDIVVGWVRSDGTTYLSDRWASLNQTPEEDFHNDLMLISGELINGVTTITFSRALDTMDKNDLALNLTDCIYLLTAIGAKADDDSFIHHYQRASSASKYCFNSCPVTTSPEPHTVPTTMSSLGPATGKDPNREAEPAPDSCDGSCSPASGCLHNVTWSYSHDVQQVTFIISALLEGTEYLGLGFSKDQQMPESDIVVGWVKQDGTTYLSDRWASARDFPLEDFHSDLILISGQLINGVTTITFSRALDTGDPSDLALSVTDCIYLLTARGPKTDDNSFSHHEQRMYSANKYCFNNCPVTVSSDLHMEPVENSTPRANEKQKPNGSIETMQNPCDGSCNSTSDCLYNIAWTYDDKKQQINFIISALLDNNEYFGLGFSKDQEMPDSDIVVGWVRQDGTTYLSDRWTDSRNLPAEDSHNDLMLISGELINGVTTVTFSRALDTRDPSDLALNVTECIYLLTAWGPKTDDNSFSYHSQRMYSANNYCFNKCPVMASTETHAEPTEKPVNDKIVKREASDSGNLHPMDCTDMVVGSARGDQSRIGDYYTRDTSTPMLDEIYGGDDGLTAALGYEEGEFTTILFRKKLDSDDPADWSFMDKPMHVVWAHGQHERDVHHSPDSAYEKNEMSDKDFYKPDVLKYHGKRNRGHVTFNFYESTNMTGNASAQSLPNTSVLSTPPTVSTEYPDTTTAASSSSTTISYLNTTTAASSSSTAISYLNTTTAASSSSTAISHLNTTTASGSTTTSYLNTTTALGSTTTSYLNTTTALGSTTTSYLNTTTALGSTTTSYLNSAATSTSSTTSSYPNVTAASPSETGTTSYLNVTTLSMQTSPVTEYLPSKGTSSFDTTLTSLLNTTATFSQDTASIPFQDVATSSVMTTQSLSPSTAATTSVSTSSQINSEPAITMVVSSAIRIVSLNYSQDLADMNSATAKKTKQAIENKLDKEMRKRIKNFDRVVVTGFRQGSVVADMDFYLITSEEDKTMVKQDVEGAMKEVLDADSLDGLKLDKTYLYISEPRAERSTSNDSHQKNMGRAEVIIIACAVALCFAAICAVIYKLLDAKKSKSSQIKQPRSSTSSSDSHTGTRSPHKPKTQGRQRESQRLQSYDNYGYDPPSNSQYTTYIA